MQTPDSTRSPLPRRLNLSPERRPIRFWPVCLPLVAALLVFPACAGKKPKYAKTDYEAAKLATPPHNMKPHEYPFDDWGRYRRDWVQQGASSGASSTASRPPSRPSGSAGASHASSAAPGPAPTPKPAASPSPPPPPAKPKPAARYHTVVKGDTLFAIGRKYGVSVSAIKDTNGLRSDLIRIGQTLRIPG